MRDLLLAKKSPEETIRKHLETYYRWSMADAGLQHIQHIPVISIATAAPNESTASVLNRLNDQLHTAAEKYYSLWIDEDATNDIELCYFHDLPTLYGVLITRSVVAILTHDTIHPGEAARFLARCDFQNEDTDGWMALALSVLFIRARNYLMELEEQGELGPEIEHVTDDPDT